MSPIVRIGRPDPRILDSLLDEAEAASVTYDHQGATLTDPPDEPARSWTLGLPRRPDPFDPAVTALSTFVPQRRGIGATIHPEAPDLQPGTTLLTVVPAGPVSVVSPLRVVEVVDEPDRFGYAYGTLPGHAVRGEESFVVHRLPDRRTMITVTNLSRPTGALAAAGPIMPMAQGVIARRYLRAVAASIIAGVN